MECSGDPDQSRLIPRQDPQYSRSLPAVITSAKEVVFIGVS